MKIATGSKSQIRHSVKQEYGNHLKNRMAFRGLKCNDMSVYSWADKHASPEVKQYVNRYNRNAPKGTVTIKDID